MAQVEANSPGDLSNLLYISLYSSGLSTGVENFWYGTCRIDGFPRESYIIFKWVYRTTETASICFVS